MSEITEADAVVVAVTQLAKVLQGEIPANIGKHSTVELTQLVNIFHNAVTKATNQWTKQQSNTIQLNQGQPSLSKLS